MHLSALRIIPLRFMLSSYQDKPTQSKCRHASAVIKIWREREIERKRERERERGSEDEMVKNIFR